MKNLLYISILLVFGCNNQAQQPEKQINIDTISKITTKNKIDNSQFYTNHDTLLIVTETFDTLKYLKDQFNEIIDNFPALYSDDVLNPDLNYSCSSVWKDIVDKNGNKKHITFGSEAGKDVYYILYAYFLKKKNGEKKYYELRNRLIDIYLNINSLFGHFQYGGTGFGHQQSRILGYAEYSVYLYTRVQNDLEKTYDITKQKEYYIKSLRQLIKDESEIDFNTLGQKKIERIKKLNRIVDSIDKAITDNFYLRRAQEFQYGQYDYY